MSKLVKFVRPEMTVFDPILTKEKDAKLDAIIALAKKTKDWPLLEEAVDAKIQEQEDFVRWWRANVSIEHGKRGKGKRGKSS